MFRRISLVAILFFLNMSVGRAATAPPRDPLAVATINQAIQAMGGVAAVTQITDSTVLGTVTPRSGDNSPRDTFRWLDSGVEFSVQIQSASGTSIFVSGHGQPASLRNGNATQLMPHMALANLPFHLPAVLLLRELNDSTYSITWQGTVTLGGVTAARIRISLDTDSVASLVTPQDWYFDSSTGLPLRVEHRLPDNLRPEIFTAAAEEFSDFRAVARVAVPFRMVSYGDGEQIAVIMVSSVDFNSGIPPGSFDLPTGGAR